MPETVPVPLNLSSVLDSLQSRKDLFDFALLPPLLDVGTVAALCGCSCRHIYRMSDSGRAPRPLKIGFLVRWRKEDIRRWIEDGCPSMRKGGR